MSEQKSNLWCDGCREFVEEKVVEFEAGERWAWNSEGGEWQFVCTEYKDPESIIEYCVYCGEQLKHKEA